MSSKFRKTAVAVSALSAVLVALCATPASAAPDDRLWAVALDFNRDGTGAAYSNVTQQEFWIGSPAQSAPIDTRFTASAVPSDNKTFDCTPNSDGVPAAFGDYLVGVGSSRLNQYGQPQYGIKLYQYPDDLAQLVFTCQDRYISVTGQVSLPAGQQLIVRFKGKPSPIGTASSYNGWITLDGIGNWYGSAAVQG